MNLLYKISILFIFISFSSSCTRKDNTKNYTIAFSQCVQDDDWRKNMLVEMKRELSFHSDVTFKLYDAKGSSSKQITQIEEILADQVDLLIVSPNESEPLSPIVDKVYQQGIPVVVVDRKTATEHYNSYVGSNNYQVGRLAAFKISKDENYNRSNNDNIIYITGLISSSASIEREKGFLDGLSEFSIHSNIIKLKGNWLPESAKEALKGVNKEIFQNTSYIFCFNDPMALATSDYLSELKLNRSPRLIGVDGLPGKENGLEKVATKTLFATLHYPTGGKETIQTAVSILNKKNYPRTVDLGTLIIDSTNVDLLSSLESRIEEQHEDIDKQQHILSELKKINQLEKQKSSLFLTLFIFSGIALASILLILRNLRESKKIISANHHTISLQNEKLENLNNELNKSLQEKLNLFKNLTYSLSNPIALLYANIKELQKKKNRYSFEQTRALHNLQSTVNRMNNVSQDIKNLENIHNNTEKGVEVTDFTILFNQITYQLISLVYEKQIKLTVENNLKKNKLILSKKWIERALYSFLDFIIKILPEHGIINLKINSSENMNGITIKVETGPFSSDEIYKAMVKKELDFGLEIVFFENVINQHNGEISTNIENNFVIFDIVFYELDRSDISKLTGTSTCYKNNNTKYKEIKETKYENHPILNEKPNLLYIDHDNIWYKLIREQYIDTHNVHFAYTFSQAKTKLEEYKFEAIISEIKIKTEIYKDFLRDLRTNSKHSIIPFIIFTTTDIIEEREFAYKKTCDLYILKNEGLHLLESGVNSVIQRQKQLINKHLWLSEKDLLMLETARSNTSHNQFINDINSIINKNISNKKFNITTLAAEMNISRVNLYNHFNEIFSITPSEYLLEIRLKKAIHLLKSTLTISEIAYQCGFSSPGYFTKVFTNKFKHTPKIYRKLHV